MGERRGVEGREGGEGRGGEGRGGECIEIPLLSTRNRLLEIDYQKEIYGSKTRDIRKLILTRKRY